MDDPTLSEIIEKVKGVECLCSSLALSSDAGMHKYAGSEMTLLADVLDGIIFDLEKAEQIYE